MRAAGLDFERDWSRRLPMTWHDFFDTLVTVLISGEPLK